MEDDIKAAGKGGGNTFILFQHINTQCPVIHNFVFFLSTILITALLIWFCASDQREEFNDI